MSERREQRNFKTDSGRWSWSDVESGGMDARRDGDRFGSQVVLDDGVRRSGGM